MYRRKESIGEDIGTAIAALVVYGAISGAIVSAISARLRVNLFVAILILVGAVGTLVCAGIAISRIIKWRAKFRRCVHGVVAGSAGNCEICNRDKEHQVEIQRQAAEKWERVATIKKRAKALRAEEIQRLSRAWLSTSESYYSMSSQQFEDAIAQLFRKLGYEVKQTPYSNDGGKDAILLKDGKKYLVECKRYNESNCIGRPDIQKFVAAMYDEAATGGFYVNTGIFSSDAKKYAESHAGRVYDRFTFPSLVIQAYPVAEDATSAKTMCFECGGVVELAVEDFPVSAVCSNGHTVSSTIKRMDLVVSTAGTTLRVITPNGIPH
jgi:hypothetical protein